MPVSLLTALVVAVVCALARVAKEMELVVRQRSRTVQSLSSASTSEVRRCGSRSTTLAAAECPVSKGINSTRTEDRLG